MALLLNFPMAIVTTKVEDEPTTQERLAQARTDLATERNLLAAERTYSAWIRTALTIIAVGFGVAQLLTSLEPRWAVMTIGTVFILVGVVTLIAPYFEFAPVLRRLESRGTASTRRWFVICLTTAIVLATSAGLLLLLVN